MQKDFPNGTEDIRGGCAVDDCGSASVRLSHGDDVRLLGAGAVEDVIVNRHRAVGILNALNAIGVRPGGKELGGGHQVV